MRRLTVVLMLGAVAVALAACGSDSKTASTSSSSAPAATTGGATVATTATTAKGSASFADVCTGRAAAAAGAASAASGQTVDYNKMATDMQFAVDHAPSDIKADMTTLATPLVQYFKLIASANGNFAVAAQNPQFATLAQRLSAADIQAAAQRVTAWFAAHCS